MGRVVKSSTESDADDRELWGLRDRKPDPSLLYKLDDAILLCVCSAHLFPEDSYTFCSTVGSIMKRNIPSKYSTTVATVR